MLLTLSTTHAPATDLGFLLHKNPAKVHAFDLAFGTAHVFYPRADESRCTAALLVEVDPVGLVRKRRGPAGEAFSLEQYVSDRPYAASSLLAVAIAQIFGSALAGRCRDKPELVEVKLPLTAAISVLPCRGGEGLLRALFEPLGYEIQCRRLELDSQYPEWGESPYYHVELSGQTRLTDLLSHLYVLIPVLDNDKHYWIGDDEVEKLLRHGEGWLAKHPAKEEIVRRYLKRRWNLTQVALARLAPEEEELAADEETVTAPDAAEQTVEQPLRLNDQRLVAVIESLRSCGAKRVLDLGCASGNLLKRLLEEKQFEQIVGLDVSHRMLEIAAERLRLERMPPRQRERIVLWHGSLTYRDKRLAGFDAAAVVEVIEHLDPPRLAALERVLFEFARPTWVIVTTPNVEYNVRFPGLPPGKLRHRDHRFEWTRSEFQNWAGRVGARFGYHVTHVPIGPDDPEVGAPTQMALFDIPA
jgi:3' terminal RNA ribose 2'-O-methyltransferase Hen1